MANGYSYQFFIFFPNYNIYPGGMKNVFLQLDYEISDNTDNSASTGKPKDIRRAKTDIGLWSMLLYGRKFVRPGQKVIITASYYYLRRSDDSFQKGVFKDFEPDKNIVSISPHFKHGKHASISRLLPLLFSLPGAVCL